MSENFELRGKKKDQPYIDGKKALPAEFPMYRHLGPTLVKVISVNTFVMIGEVNGMTNKSYSDLMNPAGFPDFMKHSTPATKEEYDAVLSMINQKFIDNE